MGENMARPFYRSEKKMMRDRGESVTIRFFGARPINGLDRGETKFSRNELFMEQKTRNSFYKYTLLLLRAKEDRIPPIPEERTISARKTAQRRFSFAPFSKKHCTTIPYKPRHQRNTFTTIHFISFYIFMIYQFSFSFFSFSSITRYYMP